jgi:uncharacterized RDD family membrane protein YckC
MAGERPTYDEGARVRAAGLVRRLLAAIVDATLVVALFIALQALASVVVGHGLPRLSQLGPGGLVDALLAGSMMAATGLALFALLGASYLVILHAGPGQTLGKRLVGIRVIDGFGQPLGLGRSFVRTLALVPSAGLAGLGVLWIGFDRERRALHDRLADTHVIVAHAGAVS